MSGFLDDSDDCSTVEVGEKGPDFTLDSERGEKWRLSEQSGTVTALLFYPKDETLVCTRQMCSVRNNWADYLEAKAAVVGISSGTIEEHLIFSQKHRLPLPLLTDVNREVTSIYGRHWLFPMQLTRAVVIIDAKGIVRHREVMLRAFRPPDKSVLTSIHAARTDSLDEHYRRLTESYKIRNPFSRG